MRLPASKVTLVIFRPANTSFDELQIELEQRAPSHRQDTREHRTECDRWPLSDGLRKHWKERELTKLRTEGTSLHPGFIEKYSL